MKEQPPSRYVVLEHAPPEREGRVRDLALTAFAEMAATASTSLDVDEVLRCALVRVLDVVGVDAGAISVLDEATEELVFRVQQGWRVHDFVSQGIRVPIDRGLSGLAVTTGQTVVTGNVSSDERVAVAEFREEPVQAMVLAPMRARGRVVGVLGVMHYEPYDFSSSEVDFVSAIADQIGVALDNACLLVEARRRVQELAALHAVSTQMASTLDLWTVLETITASALELVAAAAVEIYLCEPAGERLASATASSKDGVRGSIDGHPPPDGPAVHAARNGEVVLLQDLADSHFDVAGWRARGMRSLAVLPFRRATSVLGVLLVAFDEPHTFSDNELHVLGLLAEQAAIAIERVRFFSGETRRSAQLALINQVTRQAMATLNLGEILDTAAIAIRRNLACFNVTLFMVDKGSGDVVLRSISGGHAMVVRRGYRQAIGEGIVGWVAETGQTFLANDVSQEPRYLPIVPTVKSVGSELAVPIVRGDEVIGVLDLRNLERGAFDREDVEAIEALADQLAIAIDNARLYEETQQRVAELTALQEISLRVASALDTDAVLDAVARNALELADADDVHIYLHDPGDGGMTFGAALGRGTRISEGRREPLDRFAWAVLESNRALVVDRAREHVYFSSPEAQEWGVEAVAGFPLLGNAGTVGVMTVAYLQPHTFGSDELRVFGLLASQAAVAITNARLYGEMHRRLEELTVLHEVSLAAASSLALEEIAERVVAVVQQSLGFEHFDLFLVDEERGMLEPLRQREEGGGRVFSMGQGLVGWAADRRAVVRVGDVSQDARGVEVIPGVHSVLVVPLVVGDRVIGVVEVASSRLDAFSTEDEHLMITVARQLAVAVQHARLYQETDQRLTEVTALYQVARQVNTVLDVQERLDAVVWSLKRALGCRSCSIALVESLNDVLRIRAAAGIADQWKEGFKLRMGEGVAGRVAQEGVPIYVPDTHAVGDFIFFDHAVRSLLTVPLCVQDRVIGTLSVDSDRPNAFSAADERLLTIAAAQAAVAIENARLYASIGQRARTLAEAYDELQRVDRLREEMVQNISHELRTPLAFVKGYAELLLAGDAGPLTDAQREHLQIVIEKTNSVTRLVSDIMFLQQLDDLPIERLPVSLVKIAQRALESYADTAERAGVTLVADLPEDLPPVAGEEGRLLQVFDGLLSNAVKFSPDGGRIALRIEDAGAMVQASVTDQGIGIPDDQKDRVFERFYQVDGSTSRRFGGAGLGLTIAKRIVEVCGGRMWVESESGRGSTFYFVIPKYRALDAEEEINST